MQESVSAEALPHQEQKTSIGAVLRNRNFRLLWIGEGISLLGDQFYMIALPLAGAAIDRRRAGDGDRAGRGRDSACAVHAGRRGADRPLFAAQCHAGLQSGAHGAGWLAGGGDAGRGRGVMDVVCAGAGVWPGRCVLLPGFGGDCASDCRQRGLAVSQRNGAGDGAIEYFRRANGSRVADRGVVWWADD